MKNKFYIKSYRIIETSTISKINSIEFLNSGMFTNLYEIKLNIPILFGFINIQKIIFKRFDISFNHKLELTKGREFII